MYKGKFDQKSKGGNVQDILAQRNQPPVPEAKPRKAVPTAAPKPRPAADSPVRTPAPKPAAKAQTPAAKAPVQKPAAKTAPNAPAKKKGPRLGGVIFYTLYFMFILVFFIATFVGLLWLRGWLVDYQASQPTVKSQQVFDQFFTDPDWDALYRSSGAKDSPFEGRDAFVAYMEEKVGSSPLTYLETSAGLSGDRKYYVRLGNENVASFTLSDKNKMDGTTLENIGKLPDWQLSAVDVFFERSGSYRIEKVADHIVQVNGVPLDDSYTIQKATTKAEDYLPTGVTSAKMYTQEVTGLMAVPSVTILDKAGNQMEVTYNEETRTFTERTEANTMSDEERELALKTAETYSLFMLEKADRGDLAKYFDTTSDPYKMFTQLGELWVQDFDSYEFADQAVDKYERYSEDLFSVHVSMVVNVTRKNGTIKEFPYDNTLFFRKTDAGKWKAFQMTNVDVSAPVGQVRLSFMDGDTLLTSSFFMTNASDIIVPLPSVPEGKVFTGWCRKDVNENGVTELTLMFQPDETGKAIIPEGTDLEPMTLYALFENPSDVTVPEAETEGAE